ncbi:MAG TPA: translocation/assembly module TamB domain-containing protein [Alcanivorax sp.]|nr:translocation/assembly module TamB domain-containing protein [Alcanivorax sp.]
MAAAPEHGAGPVKRALLIGLLLIPLLLIGALLALLGTRAGNLWLLDRAGPYLPGELSVEGWRGNLLSGVSVGTLSYRQGDADQALEVALSDLHLELAPGELLGGWLVIQALRAERITLTLPAGEQPPPESAPFELPDSLALPLGVRIETLSVGRFSLAGESPLHIDRIEARELAAWRKLNVPKVALTVAGTRLHASLSGRLSTPYDLRGELDWRQPAAANAVPQTAGRLRFEGTPRALSVEHALSAPAQLITEGELGYRDGQVHLDLRHHWPAQALPVETPVPMRLGEGELTSRGTLESVRLEGRTTLTADGRPLAVTLAGNAGLESLTLDTLSLKNDGQSLTLSGRLDYRDGLAWDLAAQGRHLDPATLAPRWPGDLTLRARTQGHWRGADNWTLNADPLSLTGTLQGDPLTLNGRAHQDTGGDLSITLNGRWGADRLSVRGQVGDRLNLDGTLNIEQLSRWYAPARGRLQADWRLRGPLDAPRLSGTANGDALGYQDWRLGTLSARFQDLNAGNAPMTLALEGRTLSQNGQTRVERLNADLAGRRGDHRLTVATENQDATTTLTAQAGLNDDLVWSGRLLTWQLRERQLGVWTLAEPVPFTLGANRQSLQRLCLQSRDDPGRLCLAGNHAANGSIDANLEVRDLPLALANPWLGDSVDLDGRLRADARVGGTLEQPRGQWSLTLEDASARFIAAEPPLTLVFQQAALSGTLENGRLDQQLDLVVADQGEVHVRVESGLSLDAPMSGRLSLDIPRLDGLSPLLPRVGELQGRVHGDLNLGGTPAGPRLDGKIALSDGRATVPDLGISAEAIRLVVTGDASGALNLDGRAQLGEGTLEVGGTWTPTRSPLALDLWARGERLRIADRADAEVYVSPDLALKGDGESLNLTGTLNVPEADLQPRELPESAVTVSEDQVLVDARAEQAAPLPFAMGVTVTLGDQVRFEGFGLRATLTGELRVSQQPGQPVQLYGKLIITEGRYRAYGQNLLIENGRLLFQGAPDNPGLDIRAVRKIPSENLVVGVQLSGTLQAPKASIFSNPSLEESEAMAYLVTGRSLNRGSQSDSAQVAQALALYGLQKGSGVTDKIGDTLGLDEISVGSDWETSDAALMLGKQISDRLYLTYAVGLFDAISTVMLRYTLTRQLHLEAQSSSKSQSIDLIWEKELE